MSEAVPKREWRCFVHDMIACCGRILEETGGLDRDSLAADRLRYESVRYNLIVLGEAATKVPARVRGRRFGVPWREIVATRNRLIHGHPGVDYPGVDAGVVWQTVTGEVEPLRAALRELLAEEPR